MPGGPGETLLTTLFADCHYYFSDPAIKPAHHRFDRGSYVYLYYNAIQRQAKIEVANNAGTPEQDAFFGYLNVANVSYSYLQPTLVTLFINTGAVPDQSTWHLPALDPRNEQKFRYKLHAVDVYLWTEKDANTFMGHIKSILAADKIELKNAPPGGAAGTPHAEHRDSMSPVVQLLEKTAISSHFPPRAASAVSTQSFPGPPTPAGSAGASPNPPAAPMAYNPAAPAAPEPVQYRQKTPPPPDDGSGTGLAAAAKYDSVPGQPQYATAPGIMYQSSAQTTPQQAYFGGPPQHQPRQPSQTGFSGPPQSSSSMDSVPRSYSGSVPPPAQSPPNQQQRAPSFGPMAQSTLPQSPPPGQQSFHQHSSFAGQAPGQTQFATYNPGTQTQFANYPGTPGYGSQLPPTPSAPPPYATPLQSPAFPGPPPPQQHSAPQHHAAPQVPIGGYNNYSYAQTQSMQPGEINTMGGYTGDLHSQAYRPTEEEAKHSHSSHHAAPGPSGILNSKPVKGIEGRVNGYMKKLDKLW